MKAQSKPTHTQLGAQPTRAGALRSGKTVGLQTQTPATSGKVGKVVTMLKRPKGACLAELMKATGWQGHSVRGAISGTIKKKLKLMVLSEKVGDVRTYRIKA